jgi:hypothetical protein
MHNIWKETGEDQRAQKILQQILTTGYELE